MTGGVGFSSDAMKRSLSNRALRKSQKPKFKEQNRSSKQGKGSAIKTKKASEATLNEIRKKSRLERKRLQKKKTILLIVLAAVLWLLVIGLVA